VSKPASYFKNVTRDTSISNITALPADLIIKAGDILSIGISSLSREEDALYSTRSVDPSSTGNSGSSSDSYTVTEDGFIRLHKLGKVKAAGLTRKQFKAAVETALLPYLKDAIVSIFFGDHHITILGEIGAQQVLPLPNEFISIIDVLARSGTITPVANLTNVMIIRTTATSKEIRHVNLEDHSIFTSPYFYLQPNDVVVLSQDEKIVNQNLKREKIQQYSAVVLQAVSIALIIYQVFFRR